MKQTRVKQINGVLLVLVSLCLLGSQAWASPQDLDQSGKVTVQGAPSPPVDPENPDEEADPDEGPSTQGPLRIDYVSALDFGQADISEKDTAYHALAQQFQGATGPRGSYIQLTDQRTNATGWTLQVKQNHQFRNTVIQETAEQELNGAVLSLDKGWANSSGTSGAPTVTRETIALHSIGTAYEVATASAGNGRGVWTVTFGASDTNKNNLENTLTPIVDKSGQTVMDELYGKPAYSNSAITLSIPNRTKIYPVHYETELTWILAELP